MGRVKNDKGNVISGSIDHRGYISLHFHLNGKKCTVKVYRIVAELFIENIHDKPCVNHISGNKLDNRVENLEWSTYAENIQHAMDNNLNGCSKRIKAVNVKTNKEVIYTNLKAVINKFKMNSRTLAKCIKDKKLYKNIMFTKLE